MDRIERGSSSTGVADECLFEMFICFHDGLIDKVLVIFLLGWVFDLTDTDVRNNWSTQWVIGVDSSDDHSINNFGFSISGSFFSDSSLLQINRKNSLTGRKFQVILLSNFLDISSFFSQLVDNFFSGFFSNNIIFFSSIWIQTEILVRSLSR